MGIFSKLFKNHNEETISSHQNFVIERKVYPDGYDELDDKFYNKITDEYDKYSEMCDNLRRFFEESFNLKQRLLHLNKVISYFEKKQEFYSKFGVAGKFFFNEHFDYAFRIPETEPQLIINTPFSDYQFEYEDFDFENIAFLRKLYTDYTNNPEQVSEHLKYEKHCLDMEDFEDEEDYQFYLKCLVLPKDLLKFIKKNDGILQKDLYQHFAEFTPNQLRNEIKQLELAKKINLEKSGTTYIIHYCK